METRNNNLINGDILQVAGNSDTNFVGDSYTWDSSWQRGLEIEVTSARLTQLAGLWGMVTDAGVNRNAEEGQRSSQENRESAVHRILTFLRN